MEVLSTLWHKLQDDVYFTGTIGTLLVIILMVAYVFRLRDPRTKERAMARKLKDRMMADAISEALDGLYRTQKLTARDMQDAHRKLGHAFGLTDLIPRKEFNLKQATLDAYRRLTSMGVNIPEALGKLRSSRSKKITPVLRKSGSPLPLP